jgi:hypothetical protein
MVRIHGLKHFALKVVDPERSLRFYRVVSWVEEDSRRPPNTTRGILAQTHFRADPDG